MDASNQILFFSSADLIIHSMNADSSWTTTSSAQQQRDKKSDSLIVW